MIGPNLYYPYLVVLAYAKANFPYSVIIALPPLTFTHYSHFIGPFIAAAGFYAVGWQKKLDLLTCSSSRFRQLPRNCLPYQAKHAVHLSVGCGLHCRLSSFERNLGTKRGVDEELAGVSAGLSFCCCWPQRISISPTEAWIARLATIFRSMSSTT
jgi:hypothetical protein